MSLRLLAAQLLTVSALLAAQFAAMEIYARTYVEWVFVPSHVLGGAWAALAGAWILHSLGVGLRFIPCAVAVVACGIAWELLEVAAGMPQGDLYAFDVAFDLVSDAAGGIGGYLLARRISV